MEKLYTKKLLKRNLQPSNDTISFLLNYSKSKKAVSVKNESWMLHLN